MGKRRGRWYPRRKPNLAQVEAEGMRHCYVCDREREARHFKSSAPDVCLDCRATRAYQEPQAQQHFMRWCEGCQTYEPLTAFWREGTSLTTSCAIHQRERRRKQRLSYLGADGYRKRWLWELRQHIACSSCGSTEHLNFVHLDPSTKQFTISGAENNRTVAQIKVELRKCDVFCRECMTDIVHSELYKQGRARSTPKVRWDELFAKVDAVVEPLGRPKQTTQLELF